MNLFVRAYKKISRFIFWHLNSSSFGSIGVGTYFSGAFRIDGRKNIFIGSNTSFQNGLWLYSANSDDLRLPVIEIGDGCSFGYNNHIASIKSVKIGNNVLTANNVYISDNIHEYKDISKPIIHQKIRFKGLVEIGPGSWIGENVSIIGASIGKNSVIGANSVVTQDIPDYSVAVGVPAQIVKRFDFHDKKWIDCRNGDI